MDPSRGREASGVAARPQPATEGDASGTAMSPIPAPCARPDAWDYPGPDARSVRWLSWAIAGAIAFRAACYALMTAAAVWAERRPAPGALPDLVVDALPYVQSVANTNYLLWLVVYLPLAVVFLATEPRRWVRYMVTGGLVSLARGATIALTGLGPPDPAHAGAGLGAREPLQAWLELISPWGVFAHGTAQAYLTKDLFFSGHTATTFLLVLYLWPRRRLRLVAIAAHVLVVASVLVARLHYTIDIVGAWAITFAIFALREWRPADRLRMSRRGSGRGTGRRLEGEA